MTNPAAQSWIDRLQLNQHIEGGWYKEVYRSSLLLDQSMLPASFTGDRNACTHIYFLLEQGNFSAFHRIQSDELWHFYAGDPLIIYEIDEHGTLKEHLLGNDPNRDQSLFTFIKAGNWFASKPAAGSTYALVGCTVSPGFDFNDFEMADKEELIRSFPQHVKIIEPLCR
jgi:predicted cupin superfamily sugar epimerase